MKCPIVSKQCQKVFCTGKRLTSFQNCYTQQAKRKWGLDEGYLNPLSFKDDYLKRQVFNNWMPHISRKLIQKPHTQVIKGGSVCERHTNHTHCICTPTVMTFRLIMYFLFKPACLHTLSQHWTTFNWKEILTYSFQTFNIAWCKNSVFSFGVCFGS